MKKNIFYLFFCIVTLISCSKDNEPETEPPVEPPVNNLLKELIHIDTTQVAPYDTTAKYVFEYDGLNRLINLRYNSYNPLSASYQYYGAGIEYTYSGNSALPTKLLKTDAFLMTNSSSRYHHYFSYDSQGRLIKDSVQRAIVNNGYDSSVYSIHYVYNTNQLSYTTYNYYPAAGSYPIVTQTSEKDSRGNIVREGSANPWYFYEYDAKENPLAKANPMKVPYIRSSDFFFANVTSHIEQNNNFSKLYYRTYDASGNMLTSVLFQEIVFTYKSNGLPETSRKRNYPSSPSQDKYKLYYKY